MNNIKFCYLYRDGANYKSWGEVVFENPDGLTLEEIENKLVAAFLPDQLFIASQVYVPEKFLFLGSKLTKYDHCYHEFDCVENCKESSTDSFGRTIVSFLQDVELASKQGWKAFDILERT